MTHVKLAAALSVSALALFGCQSPASNSNNNNTHNTQTMPTTHTTTNTASNSNNQANMNAVHALNTVDCKDESIQLNLNNTGISQQGMLQGYNYCEYNIPLKAGQHLKVDFSSPSTGANVIVFDRIDLSDVALTTDGYTATSNEVLPVRVLLTRNKARSGDQVPFKVQFNLR